MIRPVALAVLALLILTAAPAAADPGTLLVAALGGTAALGTFGVAAVQLAAGLAISAISQRMRARRLARQRGPGITSTVTTAGGTTPQTLMLGTYVTGGNLVAPHYAHGEAGKVENAFRTQIIDLSDVPIEAVTALWIDDVRLDMAADLTGPVHPSYGQTPSAAVANGRFAGRVWIRTYDGRQTTADAALIAQYSGHAARPWSAGHVGLGVAYAILTFRFDTEVWRSEPVVRFEVRGARVYDWRADGTAGGTGTQREADPATWTWTDNPVVLARAVLRGIPLTDGTTYGLGVAAADLPIAWWTPAANRCDQLVDGERRYRAGCEVRMATPEQGGDTPFDVLDRLLDAASADVCDVGGMWIVQCGESGLPTATLTDDDILLDHVDEYDPFPPMSERYTSIRATHLSPAGGWVAKEAPLRRDSAAIAREGREILADLDLPAVFSDRQAQALMQAWLAEAQRHRRHVITLPPAYDRILPFDTVAWTSGRNGYSGKLFQVVSRAVDPLTLTTTLGLREVDPADYAWSSGNLLPSPVGSPVVVTPPAATVPGWAVQGIALTDGGSRQRPALRLTWTADLPGVEALRYQVRLTASGVTVSDGSTASVDLGEKIVSDGLLGNTAYQVRARLVIRGRTTVWTAWTSVSTPDVGIGTFELDQTAPVMTGGVTLTSSLVGTAGRARLVATWSAATAANGLAGYDVRIRQGAGNDVSEFAGGTRAEWDVIAGVSYTVAVRARDRLGNVSAWTAEATHVVVSDTVPPAVPTGLSVTAGIRHLWLTWAANTEADFAQYEVFESASTTAPTAGSTPTFSLLGTATVRSGLGDSTQRHYWIRAVDTSGNRSAWSARVAGTTAVNAGITSAQLIGLVNQASFATGIAAVEIVSSLPTTGNFEGRPALLTTDGKLYRFVSGAWTRSVDGADLIANSITTGSMAAGAVRAEQIASEALVARHFAVTNFLNLVPDHQFQDAASWSNSSNFTVQPTSGNTARASKGELRYIGATPVTALTASDGLSFAVTPGETLVCSFDMGRTGGTVHNAGALLRFGAHDGSLIDGIYIAIVTGETLFGARTYTAKIEVPAGAFNCRFRFYVNPGTDGQVRFWAPVVRRANGGEMIVDGSLKANHMSATDIVISGSAQIELGIITDGHIIDLQAEKITVGALNAGITVGATGVNIGTVEARAADPAARVNAAGTVIQPGKIQISGATTLANWRMGGDETHINGGEVSANTIDANKLTIGQRGLTINSLEFEHNSPAANSVSWTAGSIRYVNDAGAIATSNITAGSAAWTSGNLYLFWTKGATTISASTNQATAMTANTVVLAVYSGGTNLVANVGRTIIDGSGIKTGTVTADRVNTTSFAASGLALFGGNLQSDNYVAGATGWRITKAGAAEFSNLIVRSSLANGAVSDQWQDIDTTERKAGTALITVAQVSLGAVPRGNIYHRGVVFEMRGPGLLRNPGDPDPQFYVRLWRRSSQLGGALTAWSVIESWQIAYGSTAAWDVFSDAGNLSGYYDSFQYRLTIQGDADGSALLTCFRQAYLTVTRVTK